MNRKWRSDAPGATSRVRLAHDVQESRAPRGPAPRPLRATRRVRLDFTSSPVFFLLCLLLVGFFVAAHVAHLDLELLLAAGESMTAVTLLLLALLKNSEMRAEHAIQRKLDAIARALVEVHKDDRSSAFEDLRRSIRMEEET
ncbi:hypothetical protein [Streptomyces mexicanus]|uniref:hypothetical protein n=1 Tax=Streptomyces mexicanus TaxID=178566 RepID=UPI002E293D0A|nr:hypothetical protein [Streptomyces mexicanus]